MPTILGLAGYLLYIVCIIMLACMVLGMSHRVLEAAFPSLDKHPCLMSSLAVALPFMLKYMLWPTLVSKFRFTLPSSISLTIAILLGLASYLFYIMCMMVLSCVAMSAVMPVIPSPSREKYALLEMSLFISLPFVLKNTLWPTLLSEFPFTFPSNFSEMIAKVLGYLVYFTCMMGLSFLPPAAIYYVCSKALRLPTVKGVPDWIYMTVCGIIVCTVMDNFTKHLSVSAVMAILTFLVGYLVYIMCMMTLSSLVFNAIMVPVLPILLPGMLKYKNWAPMIIVGITLVVNDMHGFKPAEEPAIIYEFLSTMPFSVKNMKATFPGYVVHMVCMVAMFYLVLIIAAGAIYKLRLREPRQHIYIGLMVTIIASPALVLLTVMWCTPFEEPSSDIGMKDTLIGIAGYLIYIGCSVELSYWMFVYGTELVKLVRMVGLVKVVGMIPFPNTF